LKKSSKPPKTLSPEAKRLWRGLTKEYAIDDMAGLAILTAGLESYDRAQTAKALLDIEGPTVTDRWKQRKAHPAASIERDSRAAFLSALKQLNLDLEPLRCAPGRPGGGKGV
jgi:P27 family predicted phage terminase small subunit